MPSPRWKTFRTGCSPKRTRTPWNIFGRPGPARCMATVTTSKPSSVILDANVVIAFCARETGYAKAKTELERYAKDGWNFFAPGVLSAEALFVFCKKLSAGTLTTAEHAQAVQ